MPKLIITTPGFVNQWCELPDGEFAVGRDSGNAIIIREPSISGEHCQLLVFGSEVIVRDAGSKNGTFVNGARVQGQRQVMHRQTIRMGNVEARVEIDSPNGEDVTAWSAIDDLRRIPNSTEKQTFPITFVPLRKENDVK
jgi:pSer/pThr/pTyr-binding forkhead associated (FHA) protein